VACVGSIDKFIKCSENCLHLFFYSSGVVDTDYVLQYNWTRLQIYVMGIQLGFVLHHTKNKIVTIHPVRMPLHMCILCITVHENFALILPDFSIAWLDICLWDIYWSHLWH